MVGLEDQLGLSLDDLIAKQQKEKKKAKPAGAKKGKGPKPAGAGGASAAPGSAAKKKQRKRAGAGSDRMDVEDSRPAKGAKGAAPRVNTAAAGVKKGGKPRPGAPAPRVLVVNRAAQKAGGGAGAQQIPFMRGGVPLSERFDALAGYAPPAARGAAPPAAHHGLRFPY